jgi:hypothetical protein
MNRNIDNQLKYPDSSVQQVQRVADLSLKRVVKVLHKSLSLPAAKRVVKVLHKSISRPFSLQVQKLMIFQL